MSLRNVKKLPAAALTALTIAGLVLVAPGAAAHAADNPTPDHYDVLVDTPLRVPAANGVKANDGPVAAAFQSMAKTSPAHGTLVLFGDGSFDYTPETGFVGEDSFTYCLFAVAGTPCPTADIPVTLSVRAEAPHSTIERFGGADRYAVSAKAAAVAFPGTEATVFVASGAVFPDALSASAAAGAQGAPVLLIGKDAVPAPVAEQLRRLAPTKIVMLGGASTLSATVEAELRTFSAQIRRITGADRYEVSAAVSREVFAPTRTTIFIASGEVFPDALSGSAAAGLMAAPLLLVQKNAIPATVATEIARLNPQSSIAVLGGENTVSEGVVNQLKESVPGVQVLRFTGADRFAVSAGISENMFSASSTPTVFIASGAVFPDALSGSAAAITEKAPVLLVSKDTIPTAVATELDRLKPTRIVVLGGENTISAATYAQLQTHLKP